jgi:homoserine/homoserine lactone efflux protein
MDLYLLFLLMATATVLSPGPGVLMTLTNALHHGRRETFAGVLGIAFGALIVATLSATSIGVVLAASPLAYTVLKYAGAAYLVYLGMRLWRAPALSLELAAAGHGSAWRRFVEGSTLQLSNPKAIVFFLSVFPQFIRATEDYAPQFALLVLTYGALVVLIHCLYAACAQHARRWFASGAGGRTLQRTAGTVFILFAVGLVNN